MDIMKTTCPFCLAKGNARNLLWHIMGCHKKSTRDPTFVVPCPRCRSMQPLGRMELHLIYCIKYIHEQAEPYLPSEGTPPPTSPEIPETSPEPIRPQTPKEDPPILTPETSNDNDESNDDDDENDEDDEENDDDENSDESDKDDDENDEDKEKNGKENDDDENNDESNDDDDENDEDDEENDDDENSDESHDDEENGTETVPEGSVEEDLSWVQNLSTPALAMLLNIGNNVMKKRINDLLKRERK